MNGLDVRLIEVFVTPSVDGDPLTIEFHAPAATGARFDVQVLPLAHGYESGRPRHTLVPLAATEVCTREPQEGAWICVIPEIEIATCNRLAVIVTRLDGGERPDARGEYTLTLRLGAG